MTDRTDESDIRNAALEEAAWCQPDYEGKIHPRKFMVVYEDSEMGNAVFEDEAEAREHFEKASINWNCYLFGLMPREELPIAPRGGIEPDWHLAFVSLRRRFRKLEKAAAAVIAETDRIHDNEPWPVKYQAPYAAITALREVLKFVGSSPVPAPRPFTFADPSAQLQHERHRAACGNNVDKSR